MSEKGFPQINEWQLSWGSPRALFTESEGHLLEIAFLLALLLHLTPFSFLWHKKITKPASEILTLENVELIEPEPEIPPAPQVEVQKPKSALEFLKIALPVFRKPQSAPEIPKEIPILPKTKEVKLAEPEKLVERKLPVLSKAPEIRLDQKSALSPKVVEIEQLQPTVPKNREPISREPQLKLEEVGKRAVSLPASPEISLDRSSREKAVEIAALPKTNLAKLPASPQEKLVEKTYLPSSLKSDSPPATSLPLGYPKRGISLESPREVARPSPKVEIQKGAIETPKKDEPITISKKRAEITGPLSHRKIVKSFLPAYPEWAKRQNIEAELSIRFTVTPSGDVGSQVIQRTSGYPELDKIALEELKKWKFSAVDSMVGDQWGVITFRFLLE